MRIEAYEPKTYQINSSRIAVQGLEDEYELSFEDAEIPVTINGLKKDLDRLNASAIPAEINVEGLAEGTHRVTLNLKLDEEYYAYQPITIAVSISPREPQEDQPDNSQEPDSEEQIGEQDNQNE